jgi:hypothetical protein
MLQRTLPAGFIAPCLPTKTDKLPSGGQWLHEIKHDGFRIIARKNGAQVRLYSRPGNDLTHRFPLIVETLARMRLRSCIIDACDDKRALTNAANDRRLSPLVVQPAFSKVVVLIHLRGCYPPQCMREENRRNTMLRLFAVAGFALAVTVVR